MTSHELSCAKKRQSNFGMVISFQAAVLSLVAGPQTIAAQDKQDGAFFIEGYDAGFVGTR
jgi:hypothetical protein